MCPPSRKVEAQRTRCAPPPSANRGRKATLRCRPPTLLSSQSGDPRSRAWEKDKVCGQGTGCVKAWKGNNAGRSGLGEGKQVGGWNVAMMSWLTRYPCESSEEVRGGPRGEPGAGAKLKGVGARQRILPRGTT